MKNLSSILIVIPVINEKKNLEILIPKILAYGLPLTILIVDDDSDDGTANWLHANFLNKSVEYIRRDGRYGIGSAHVLGLLYSIDNNFEFCITMDGDQTHDPLYIPIILKELQSTTADIVLTSRFLEQGGLTDWNLTRKFLTYLGHLLTMLVFRTKTDLTSGMRGYAVLNLEVRMMDWLKDSYYEFFPMSYYYSLKSGKNISEIPVNLPFRAHGNSKINIILILRNVSSILFTKAKYRKYQRGY